MRVVEIEEVDLAREPAISPCCELGCKGALIQLDSGPTRCSYARSKYAYSKPFAGKYAYAYRLEARICVCAPPRGENMRMRASRAAACGRSCPHLFVVGIKNR